MDCFFAEPFNTGVNDRHILFYQILKYLRIVTRLKLNHVKNFEAKPLVFYRPRMVREPCRRILRDTEPYVFFGIGKYVYRVEASRVFRVESIVRA